PTLKPVITSSNINNEPYSFVISLKPCKNPSTGGTTPILPATGSTITPAMSSPNSSKATFNDAKSLYGTDIVFLAIPSGTPGESSNPKVATPDPALIKSESL